MASNTEKLRQEVLSYASEIKKLREELEKTKKGTVEYEIIQRKLNATQSSGNKVVQNYISALEKLNKNVHIQNEAFEKGEEAVSEYTEATTEAKKGVLNLASGFVKTIATVGRFFIAYQALNLVMSGLKELVIGSLKEFIALEGTLGKVAAVTGANSKQMKVLTDAIQDTSVQTRFTSAEIAELAVSLGKLGATSEEIPNLIKPIAAAAQAIGEDISSVGEAVLKANNQFGISSENSAITAAVLTDAVTKSALSLSSFNTAMQYVGPLASQVGLQIDQTSGYMKVLADNGFTASKIGTGLRNIFIQLKESGKPLTQTLRELAEENTSLTEAVKLVGVRSAAQLITLLKNIDALEDYTTATEAITQSLKAEAAQMSTTEAQLGMLDTAYKNIKISIGEAINSNEFLIEVLGLLDEESEKLARTNIALNKVLSDPKGAEIFEQTLKRASEKGLNPMIAAMDVLIRSGNSADNQFILFFKDLTSQLKLSERDALKVAKAFSESQSKTTQEEIKDELNLQVDALRILNDLFKEYGGVFSTLDEGYYAVQGISDVLENQSAELRRANLEQSIRDGLYGEYAERIKDIAKAEGEGLLVQGKIDKLRGDIAKNKEKDVQAAKDLEASIKEQYEEYGKLEGGIAAAGFKAQEYLVTQEAQLANLKLRINSYDSLEDSIRDLGSLEEENRKAAINQLKEEEQERIAALKSRLDGINKERDAVLAERDVELQAAKDIYDLRVKNGVDLAEAQKKYDEDIAEANKKASDQLQVLGKSINGVSQEATQFRNELKASLQALGIDEAQADKISYQIYSSIVIPAGEAEQAIVGVINALDPTEFEKLNRILKLSSIDSDSFAKNLKELKKEFGENAEYSRKFKKRQEELKEASIASLQALRDQIEGDSEAAEISRGIIDKQIEGIKEGGTQIKSFGDIATEVFKETFVDAAKTALNAIGEFNQVAYDNTVNRLEQEKARIQERSEFEQDIIKSQLQSQLISQEEYAARLEQIKKKEVQRQNAVDKKIFEEDKKRDKQEALTNYLSALAQIVPKLITEEGVVAPTKILILSAITGALATVAYNSQVSAIDKRQFFPKKFAEGGMVEGPSHEQGGIPFTVRGVSGYEMEGGEYIINKRSAAKYKSLLDQINDSRQTPKYKFATGGIVGAVETSEAKQIELLEAIAEATTGTALNTGRPVRAFVSSSDLQNDTNARRIKDRNSNI